MSKFYNVTGATGTTVELLQPNIDRESVGYIMLTNVHATADATVTLFIQNDPPSGTSNTYNLIHTIAIPADSSLVLDNPKLFDFTARYGLYITVGGSDTVDIIMA
jgi:hypothetical protein